MLNEVMQELVVLIFMVVIVNLLVIPTVYKKLMMFYLQFMVILIILRPVIRIMGNEVTDSLGFEPFVSEEVFDSSVKSYQNQLEDTLTKLTYDDVSEQLQTASVMCQVEVMDFTLEEQLILSVRQELSPMQKACLASELDLSESDIVIMEGEING